MTDPEVEYARLVSGDAGAVRSAAEGLDASLRTLTGVREDIAHAEGLPDWSGGAAMAFALRTSALRQGLSTTRTVVARVRGALETAADAYDTAVDQADHYIAFWRNRPAALPAVVEEVFALLVNARLLSVGSSYNAQLSGIRAVLTGEEVDLDELDEETRRWVEEGLAKNEEWLEDNNSGFGPLIPLTAATGDDRGLIPQGLGYDPGTGLLVQGYYTKDGESYVALIDGVTGQAIGEARLGGYDRPGSESGGPTHAGGVTVVGDDVHVVDNGEVYTYSLTALRAASAGETVPQSAAPQTGLDGGSYSAYKDGRLYLGDHERNQLSVYERGAGGQWVKVDAVPTPDNCQGVLVRDGEYVFSASSGRHEDHSQLYVQDFDGNRSDPYPLPSMSQGVVEVDGNLVVTYESGAEEFDHALNGSSGWWWGLDDYRDLWANPQMTTTPLSELGLGEDVEVVPGTLQGAAAELAGPVGELRGAAAEVDSVRVPAHVLGEVPQAALLSASVKELTTSAADSLRTGSRAVDAVAELLRSTAQDYTRTDEGVSGAFGRMTPG